MRLAHDFGNAGAYAEGIAGLGIQTHKVWNGRVTFFVQGLIGSAGGGNISTGEGLIVKPSADSFEGGEPTRHRVQSREREIACVLEKTKSEGDVVYQVARHVCSVAY